MNFVKLVGLAIAAAVIAPVAAGAADAPAAFKICATCHKASFCADCHTNQVEMKPSVKYGNRPDREMPHRGNFLTLHKIEGKLDPASCYRCHGRANNERCVACHH